MAQYGLSIRVRFRGGGGPRTPGLPPAKSSPAINDQAVGLWTSYLDLVLCECDRPVRHSED